MLCMLEPAVDISISPGDCSKGTPQGQLFALLNTPNTLRQCGKNWLSMLYSGKFIQDKYFWKL